MAKDLRHTTWSVSDTPFAARIPASSMHLDSHFLVRRPATGREAARYQEK